MRKLIAALMFAVAATLSMCSLPVTAAAMFTDPVGNTVTLLETPCVNEKAIAEIPKFNQIVSGIGLRPRSVDKFRAAHLMFEGKPFQACWTVVNNDVVVLDDGGTDESIFGVPMTAFHKMHAM